MRVLREKSATLPDLLPENVMSRLLEAGVARTYTDGQVILQRGDVRPALSIVTSGQVVAGNIGLDGSFLASALLRPGETFGDMTLFAGLPLTQTLWAQGRTEITHVSRNRFMPLFDSQPSIPRALLTISLLRTNELVEFLDVQRRLSLSARLARLLLTAFDTQTGSETVECRHEDLAFMLGVSRVAIGKALERLEKDSLIVRQYGRIDVPNVQRLRTWVDSEDQLMPLEAT